MVKNCEYINPPRRKTKVGVLDTAWNCISLVAPHLQRSSRLKAGIQKKTKCLPDLAKLEGDMRFTKVNIKSHTDKSQAWKTSRLPCFIEVFADSIFECIDAHASWQLYHPLTPLTDVHHLKSGKLVCLAGRVSEPPPDVKKVTKNGEEVKVSNAAIRNENG